MITFTTGSLYNAFISTAEASDHMYDMAPADNVLTRVNISLI